MNFLYVNTLFSLDLWNVYGECENFAILKGHNGAILDMHYTTDGEYDNFKIIFYLDTYCTIVGIIVWQKFLMNTTSGGL